jgi:hypothetical protein
MSSYKDIPSKSEADLQAAVASIGPISVAIDASKTSFQVFSIAIYYKYIIMQCLIHDSVILKERKAHTLKISVCMSQNLSIKQTVH